jgi:hypothetical protein
MAGMRMHPREYAGRGSLEDERYRAGDDELDDDERPVQPSAKALGKRPAVADPYDSMRECFPSSLLSEISIIWCEADGDFSTMQNRWTQRTHRLG